MLSRVLRGSLWDVAQRAVRAIDPVDNAPRPQCFKMKTMLSPVEPTDISGRTHVYYGESTLIT